MNKTISEPRIFKCIRCGRIHLSLDLSNQCMRQHFASKDKIKREELEKLRQQRIQEQTKNELDILPPETIIEIG